MLEAACKQAGEIAVVSNVAVDERDDITVRDAATNEVIWKKDYYSFKAAAVYELILKHFKK